MNSTGKERDTETGLDYFGARHYGLSLGRFMSVDPKAASGKLANPQSLNRYAYVQNDPMDFIDALGLDGTCTPTADGGLNCVSNVNASADGGSGLPTFGFGGIGGGGGGVDPGPPPLIFRPGSGGGGGGGNNAPPCLAGAGPLLLGQSRCGSQPPCIPRDTFNSLNNAVLTAMTFYSQKTGVSYFVGVTLNVTFAQFVGATVGGSIYFASDPQGNLAVVQSPSVTGAIGGRSRAFGLMIGGATFQNVNGFGGASYAQGSFQISGKRKVDFSTGFGVSNNSSGTQTSAFVGVGSGSRASGGLQGLGSATVTAICTE